MSRTKYTITDEAALLTAAPHLFRQVPAKDVPDHVKIRAALKAGYELPGVQITAATTQTKF